MQLCAAKDRLSRSPPHPCLTDAGGVSAGTNATPHGGTEPMHDEPVMDVAHLGHLEMLTPKPEESPALLRRRDGHDGERAAGRQRLPARLGRLRALLPPAHRARRPPASATPPSAPAARRRWSGGWRRCERLRHEVGWHEGELGHGPAYRFRDPDGHLFELYYETEWYEAPPELRPALKNQAQRFPARGVNVRRLDHFNCLAVDVRGQPRVLRAHPRLPLHRAHRARRRRGSRHVADLHQQELRLRLHRGGARRARAASTTSPTRSTAARTILQAADVFLENGVFIETGPHKHAVQQTFFLYVYEPGGNRVEVANAGARLVLAPDWKPITWTEAERRKGQAWGLKTIESFHTHGTPPLPGQHGDEVVAGGGRPVGEGDRIVTTASKTALVVSAHSADFVWRAGGAIALHAERGITP